MSSTFFADRVASCSSAIFMEMRMVRHIRWIDGRARRGDCGFEIGARVDRPTGVGNGAHSFAFTYAGPRRREGVPAALDRRERASLDVLYELLVEETSIGLHIGDDLDSWGEKLLSLGMQRRITTVFRPSEQTAVKSTSERSLISIRPGFWCRLLGLRSTESATISDRIDELVPKVDRSSDAPWRVLPPGSYNIFLPAAVGGVLAHELFGHPAEVDDGRTSWLAQHRGEPIGDPSMTVEIDPLVDGGWGSHEVDDAGASSTRCDVMRNGIVMLPNSDEQGRPVLPGHLRRQSFKHPLVCRMSNVVLTSASDTPSYVDQPIDLIVEEMGGGSCDPQTGRVELLVKRAKVADSGGSCGPFTLRCEGLDLLSRIRALAGDPTAAAPGYCFKMGQRAAIGEYTSPLLIVDQFVTAD